MPFVETAKLYTMLRVPIQITMRIVFGTSIAKLLQITTTITATGLATKIAMTNHCLLTVVLTI